MSSGQPIITETRLEPVYLPSRRTRSSWSQNSGMPGRWPFLLSGAYDHSRRSAAPRSGSNTEMMTLQILSEFKSAWCGGSMQLGAVCLQCQWVADCLSLKHTNIHWKERYSWDILAPQSPLNVSASQPEPRHLLVCYNPMLVGYSRVVGRR